VAIVSLLSIELTPEQHQRVKDVAKSYGQTIEDYLREQVLVSVDDAVSIQDKALQELEAFLQPRVEETKLGKVLDQSVESIFAQVRD